MVAMDICSRFMNYKIITQPNSCGKLLLAWLATKGKSLKEPAALHCQKFVAHTKRDQFMMSKKMETINCIRMNGGCAILRLLLNHSFNRAGKVY